jgi:hypothetical protein
MKTFSGGMAGIALATCLGLQACVSLRSDAVPGLGSPEHEITHELAPAEAGTDRGKPRTSSASTSTQDVSIERRTLMLLEAEELERQARSLNAEAKATEPHSFSIERGWVLGGAAGVVGHNATKSMEVDSLLAKAAELRRQAYAGLDRGASNGVSEIAKQSSRDEILGEAATADVISGPGYSNDLVGRNGFLERLLERESANERSRRDQLQRRAEDHLHSHATAVRQTVDVESRGLEDGTPTGAAATSHGPGQPRSPAASAATATQTNPSLAANLAMESEKIDGLVRGSAAVSAPSKVRVGNSFMVHLRISPDQLAAVMRELKDEFPENQTVKGKHGIRLTPRMTASVAGFGFEIAPKDGQLQAVSGTETTTWSWEVKALESGLHTLTFTLSGLLAIEDKEVTRNFYQYQQKVEVEVSPANFLQQYWQWIVTTLAVPAFAALWALFRKSQDRAGQRQPSLAQKLRARRHRQDSA